jgi:hypothetical protein
LADVIPAANPVHGERADFFVFMSAVARWATYV